MLFKRRASADDPPPTRWFGRFPGRPRGNAVYEFDDWRDGEMLIQSLIETPEEVDRAATHQAHLEKLMVAAGGIAGHGSIGGSTSASPRAAALAGGAS